MLSVPSERRSMFVSSDKVLMRDSLSGAIHEALERRKKEIAADGHFRILKQERKLMRA